MTAQANDTKAEIAPIVSAFNRAFEYWDEVHAGGLSQDHRVGAINDIYRLLPEGMYRSDAGQILDGAKLADRSEAHEQELNDLLLILTNCSDTSLKELRDKEGIGQRIPEPDSSALYALARVTLYASGIHGGELPQRKELPIPPPPSDLGLAGLRILA